MKFFKVSFSADSLEGLTSLSGLNTSSMHPSSQNVPGMDNNAGQPGSMGPPPVPGGFGISSGGSDQGGPIPPAPPLRSTGISGNLVTGSDRETLPPTLSSGGTEADGGSFTETPPPSVPDSLSPNAQGGQSNVDPPPGPPKKQTKGPKKPTKP